MRKRLSRVDVSFSSSSSLVHEKTLLPSASYALATFDPHFTGIKVAPPGPISVFVCRCFFMSCSSRTYFPCSRALGDLIQEYSDMREIQLLSLLYDHLHSSVPSLPLSALPFSIARLRGIPFKMQDEAAAHHRCVVVSRQLAMEEDECDGVTQRFALRNSSERRWQEARRDTKERRKYVFVQKVNASST